MFTISYDVAFRTYLLDSLSKILFSHTRSRFVRARTHTHKHSYFRRIITQLMRFQPNWILIFLSFFHYCYYYLACVWETRLHRTECPRKCWITHVKCQNISSFRRTFKLNRIQTANNIFLINFFDGYVSSRANGFQYPLNLTWLGRISKLIRRETTKISVCKPEIAWKQNENKKKYRTITCAANLSLRAYDDGFSTIAISFHLSHSSVPSLSCACNVFTKL